VQPVSNAAAGVMNMIDDARGTTLVRFGDEETTWAAADVVQLLLVGETLLDRCGPGRCTL
jgi:hypothetical protein